MGVPRKFHKLNDVATIVAGAESVSAAARELGVTRSTVQRWLAAGKVQHPARGRALRAVADRSDTATAPSIDGGGDNQRARHEGERFSDWCRRVLVLSPSEEEIVTLAQQAFDASADATLPWPVRLAASREYRACRRELEIPLEEGDEQHGSLETVPESVSVRRFPA